MYQKATSQCCTEIVYTYSANSSSFFRSYAQAAVVSAPPTETGQAMFLLGTSPALLFWQSLLAKKILEKGSYFTFALRQK